MSPETLVNLLLLIRLIQQSTICCVKLESTPRRLEFAETTG
jgi:hypothetical protein